MKIADLFVDLRLDTGALKTDLNKALVSASSTARMDIPLESRDAERHGKRAGSRFSDGFKRNLKIGAAIGGAFAVAGAGKFLKSSVEEASNLEESINAVDVTFGKAAGGIKKLGREAADSVGLSNSEFNGLAVQFSSFADTIAGKGGDVTGTMEDLTGRSADFASVMNLDVADAAAAFQSGLAGETEPLKKFGINLSAAAVESYAFAKGIAAPGEEMTEQQKIQARYGLLMKQTQKTQGDFANTSDSLANSQRVLGANFDDIQAKVGSALLPSLAKLSGFALNKVLPALESFGGYLKSDLLPPLKELGGFIRDEVAPRLKELGEFLWDNKGALAAMAAVVASGVVAWKAYVAVQKVMAVWTKRQAILQGILNTVMRLNPVGIVITALTALGVALVIAYKKSDTFREIVDKAWSKIRKVIKKAWKDHIKPALADFRDFLVDKVFPVINKLWEDVVKPVFKAVRKGIKLWWNYYVKPIFKALKFYFEKVVFPVIRFLWKNVVKPVFKNIADGISKWWNKIVKPVFKALKKFFKETLFPIIRFLWKDVVKPVFKNISDGIKDAWQNKIKPVFTTFANFIRDDVAPKFRKGVKAIKTAWENITGALKKPVRAVIDTVINKGIIGSFNWIAGKVPGVSKIDKFKWSGGSVTRAGNSMKAPGSSGPDHLSNATGGVLPGFTPGRDVFKYKAPGAPDLHLGGGEGILTTRTTAMLGGKAGITALNRWGENGGKKIGQHGLRDKAKMSFFSGGVIPLQAGQLTNNHGSGYYGASFAGDFNGPLDLASPPALVKAWKAGRVSGINYSNSSYGNQVRVNHGGQWTRYAHLSSIIARVGQMVKAGQALGRVGSTGNSTGAHLHFEIHGGASPISLGGGDGGSGGDQGVLPGWAKKFMKGPIRWFSERLQSGTDKIKGKFGSNFFTNMLLGLPKKAIKGITDYLVGPVEGTRGPGSGSGIGVDVSGISGPVVKQVRSVAKKFGWGRGSQWSALKELIQAESSWNPNAANPTSSARGLFQKMTSIHGPVEKTAAGQAAWGLNYIKGRYSNPAAAWAFHKRNNYYDNGGYLEAGRTLAVNKTGKPEPVLTDGQWQNMERMISLLERQAGAGGSGAPFIQNAVIRETVDIERLERQRAFRERAVRI